MVCFIGEGGGLWGRSQAQNKKKVKETNILLSEFKSWNKSNMIKGDFQNAQCMFN
jgi:hypothetical protein